MKASSHKLFPTEMEDIFERITDAFVALDNNWCYTYVNKKAGEIFKRAPSKMIGRNIWKEFPEAIDQNFYKAYHRAMAEQQYTQVEEYYPRYDKWFENDIYPSPEGLSILFRDITEQKKVEELLRESKEKFATIFKAAPGSIILSSLPDGRMVEVNDNFCSITGYSSEEALGKTTAELNLWTVPSERERFLSLLQVNGVVKDFEADLNHKSGAVLRGLISGHVISISTRKYVFGIFYDITERRKLEEQQTLFSNIVNSTDDGVLSKNLEGVITSWNPGAEKLFGYSLKEITGKNISILISGHRLNEEKEIIEQIKRGSSLIHFETERIRKNGTIIQVCLTISPIRDLMGNIIGATEISRDITETKKLEDLLDKSNRLAKIGNWDADLIMGTVYWSAVTKEIYETATDYVPNLTQGLDFFLEGKNRDQITQCMQACVEDGTAWDLELQIVTAKGNLKWVRTIGDAAFMDGKCIRIYGSIQDIDEHKKAEQKLAQSETHLRTILQTEPECIKLVGPNGELLNMNPAGLAMLEADNLDQVLGHNIEELLMPENKAAFAQMTKEVFEGNSGKLEFKIKGLKGTERWLETHAVPLKDAEGKIVSLLGVTRDITESKKAEQALVESEEKYRSLIQNSPDIIIQLDLEEKVRFINHTEAGFTKEQVIGKSAYDFVMPEFHKVVREAHKKVLQNQQSQTYETVGLGHDGVKRWFFTNAGPIIINDKVAGITLITRDISERKKAEEEILSTTAQLRQLAAHLQNIREEERKRIGREIHDDLGQQLTAIKMDVAWIDKKTSNEFSLIKPKLKNIITLLDGSNESVRKILNELRAGVLDRYGLVDALEWQGQQFTLNTGIPLLFTCNKTGIPTDEAITTCIYRIFQETLNNITKYANAKKVISSLSYSNEKIVLKIKDDGVGFDITMPKNNQSFGILGMKERVASLGGDFELLSKPGKGTTVRISLPLKK